MDNSVDKQQSYFRCVSFIFHPQPPVYDISRAIPEDFRVFPNFPRYYYEYYILSFYSV